MNQLPRGLAGFLAARQQGQQEENAELQQAGALQQILAGRQQQQERAQSIQREQALRDALAASNGDPEKALEIVVKRGDLAGAAKLAPIVKIHQERKQAEETKRGLSALLAPETAQPQNPMIPGPGASVMAGSGSVTPQPAPQVTPDAARQKRIEALKKMSLQFAHNPAAFTAFQREIDKLEEAAKPGRQSQLGMLIAERDKHPIGSPDRKIYDQAITKFQPGGVQVNVHPNDPLVPGRTAMNRVDEGLLDAGMRQQQLKSIEAQFKPEYQQIATKFGATWSSIKDKAGVSLPADERQRLTEFSQFKRNSIDALNQYIKSITGAAMTNAEAERILRGLPNPGTGLLDGDSPTEFKAKLDDTVRQVRMAEARLVYIKRNGMNLGNVTLDRMPTLMNERGAALEATIRTQKPNLPDADVRKLVRRNLAQEFGLVE